MIVFPRPIDANYVLSLSVPMKYKFTISCRKAQYWQPIAGNDIFMIYNNIYDGVYCF